MLSKIKWKKIFDKLTKESPSVIGTPFST